MRRWDIKVNFPNLTPLVWSVSQKHVNRGLNNVCTHYWWGGNVCFRTQGCNPSLTTGFCCEATWSPRLCLVEIQKAFILNVLLNYNTLTPNTWTIFRLVWLKHLLLRSLERASNFKIFGSYSFGKAESIIHKNTSNKCPLMRVPSEWPSLSIVNSWMALISYRLDVYSLSNAALHQDPLFCLHPAKPLTYFMELTPWPVR